MNGSPPPSSSRKVDPTSADPSPLPLPAPDPPRFLPGAVLGDPTLRTPGSDIPEALYTLSDAEPFNLPQVPNLPADSAEPQIDRRLVLGLALLLIAIILSTAVYLYRDTHPSLTGPHSLLCRSDSTLSG